jgi:Family of unknown function (DUF6190)
MIGEAVIDTVTFLGMHSTNDTIRGSCKTFFARRLHDEIWMSLEHVGWCDDIVWRFPRKVQDAYYPFMDALHTDMAIRRVGYDELDISAALTNPALTELPMCERLLIGMVLRHDAVLYTVNPRLRQRRDLPVVAVPAAKERQFPKYLEQLYQVSLALRLPHEAV